MIRIENWSITLIDAFNPYQPPEGQVRGLHGKVYGHPGFADGEEVTTSRIVGATKVGREVMVNTSNGSMYVLGAIEPGYDKKYPNARNKLTRNV